MNLPPDAKGELQRQARSKLIAPAPQKPCDVGLFSDDSKQSDLVDEARRK